ncbi:MAG TPA: hypothetical protein PLW97_09170 [Synergistaceae bacterium]|nr:hypothetical protein [Synergistaceae bacterium]
MPHPLHFLPNPVLLMTITAFAEFFDLPGIAGENRSSEGEGESRKNRPPETLHILRKGSEKG